MTEHAIRIPRLDPNLYRARRQPGGRLAERPVTQPTWVIDDPVAIDAWPHTSRVLPWSIAVFMAMLWIVPFDAVSVPVALPFDSKLDRFAIAGLFGVWMLTKLASGEYRPRHTRSIVNVAVIAFVGIAAVSVVVNLTNLSALGESALAIKKLSLLFSFAALFYIIVTSIRPAELRAFMTLNVVLASITAIGTIIEYRTGVNYFYSLASDLLPGLSVEPKAPGEEYGRPNVSGPARHGLAITAMLAMAAPYALTRLMDTTPSDGKKRWWWGFAAVLLFTAGIATVRKTGVVAPVVGLLVLIAYRPKQMLRLAPLGAVFVAVTMALAPGALSAVKYELLGGSEDSNSGRTVDYAAVGPDIGNSPVIGRGFGSYDPQIHTREFTAPRHRLLDNQLLMLAIETGLIGLVLYLAIPLLSAVSLHRVARGDNPSRAGPALAVIASCAIFAVANFLFDALAFPQMPYVFFMMVGFGVVAATGTAGSPAANRHPPAREAAHGA